LMQLFRHLLDCMLRARNRQPITRDDDYAVRIAHDEGRVVRAAAAIGFLRAVTCRGYAPFAAEAAEYHGEERPVHGLAHDIGQDRAGASYEGTGDDQHGIAKRETD